MKSLSLFTSVFSLMFVTWVFSLWMDPERVCLGSPLVSGVTVESSSGEIQEVPECFLLSRLVQPELEPENQELLKDFLDRINGLESAMMILPSGWKPVAIELSFFQPFVLKNEYDKLLIGAEFLRNQGLLEKAVLQEILLGVYGTPDRYALELVSDFLTSVAMNRWVHADSPAPSSFLSHVVSFREYCYSDLKSIFHWDYCINQNSLLDVVDNTPGLKDVTIWGLRDFLAHRLWERYASSGLEQKQQLLSVVKDGLKKEDYQYPAEVLSLGELAEWTSVYLRDFVSLELPVSELLSVSMVVDLREVPGEPLTSLPSADDPVFQKHSIQEVLLQHRGGVTHIPSFRKLSLSMNEVRARYLILPTCRDYTFSELARFEAERVVIIEGCESVEWNWPELLKRELMGYLRGSNKKFAMFHSNSLKFALKQGLVQGAEKFELSSPEMMKRKYAWKSLLWNKTSLAYRPLSDINMITLIR